MNVMQLNTDIYNSLGVLSNTEWFVLEHNNAESCRHHCQQDSLSKTEPKSLPCNFYQLDRIKYEKYIQEYEKLKNDGIIIDEWINRRTR